MPEGQRKLIMFRRFKNVKQLKDLSVSEFITYFKNLEVDLDEFTEGRRV